MYATRRWACEEWKEGHLCETIFVFWMFGVVLFVLVHKTTYFLGFFVYVNNYALPYLLPRSGFSTIIALSLLRWLLCISSVTDWSNTASNHPLQSRSDHAFHLCTDIEKSRRLASVYVCVRHQG